MNQQILRYDYISLCITVLFVPICAQTAQQITAKFLLLIDSSQVTLPNDFINGLSEQQDNASNLTASIFINTNNPTTEDESYNSFCRELSAGITIVVDTTPSGWPRARLTADALGVPYLRAEASIAPFARAATAYALRLNASDAALIFQNEAELEQALSALLGSTRLRVTVHNRIPENTAKMLRDTRPWPDMFILFADSSAMGALIEAAVGGGLVTQNQQWLLVLLNFPNAANNKWLEDLPVAVGELRPSFPEMCCPLQGSSAGCDCVGAQVVQGFLNRLANLLVELVTSGGSDLNDPRKFECGSNISGDDEASISTRRDRFAQLMAQVLPQHPALLYDSEKRLLGYRAIMDVSVVRAHSAGRTALASWSPDRGLVVTSGRQVAGPRTFMQVAMIEAEPWSRKDNATNQWSGYCFDFLVRLSEMMDFDYEIIKPIGLGDKIDGMWTGSINLLLKKELDLIIAPMTMTSEREEVVDFIVPYFDQTGISIVIRQPVQTTSLFKFMTVLKPEVWLSVLGALIATGIMIWMLDRLSPYSFRNDPARYPYPCRQFTLKESFWFALTSFTPQGGGEAPKAMSARALVAAYWLFVVLMLATFTANLAAFLTVERLQVPVQSMEQLARQSRVSYAVQRDSSTHKYFQNMKNAETVLYRSWMQTTLGINPQIEPSTEEGKYRVWNYPIREQYSVIVEQLDKNFVETPQEGIQKVLASEDGSFAFIHDSAWLRYEVSRSCLLAEVGEVFAEQPYALAVYQGHPRTQDFSRTILTLQRERFFEELTARHWNQSIRAQCPSANDGEGISLESIGGVFIATLFGLGLAVITLVGEIIYHRHIKKKTEQSKQEPPDTKQSLPTFPPQPIIKKRPSVNFNTLQRKTVTLGESKTFETKTGLPKVSYITVYPKQ